MLLRATYFFSMQEATCNLFPVKLYYTREYYIYIHEKILRFLYVISLYIIKNYLKFYKAKIIFL